MSYDVRYKLSPPEISAYITLVKFSDDFRVLGLLFEKAGYEEAAAKAAEMSREIRQHLTMNFK